jgi:hypothetical protein
MNYPPCEYEPPRGEEIGSLHSPAELTRGMMNDPGPILGSQKANMQNSHDEEATDETHCNTTTSTINPNLNDEQHRGKLQVDENIISLEVPFCQGTTWAKQGG